MRSVPETSWPSAVRLRVRTLAWQKATANTVFLIVFFQLYLWLQKHPAFEVTQIPATSIDHWVGFQPWSIVPYLSLWVYTALPVALQADGARFLRYGYAMTGLCLVGLLTFYFWPSSVSDAVGTRPGGSALFSLLYAVDNNGNACPSLHVATAVLSCMGLFAILRQIRAPSWLQAINVLWCIGIVFSTMATKQHLLLDVLAGAALGLLAGAIWLRRGGPV